MSSRLYDHLIKAHGRTAGELHWLPLADVHRFEHVEQDLGLVELDHVHTEDEVIV